jgi:alpha-amylase/alpha-mannosidase (GH57 family)
MERYICIHGHFYQPPRESPWLETIEYQASAYPYHDWNARITAECYAPNATSRILDGEGYIAQIVNNYANMSFNFGPTLLSWLQSTAPEVYGAILEADRDSQERFSGHGSALAQAYNHMIMPLANRQDKHTQVCWGIEDFVHRFGRKPEGMWLPETAVDLETLEILVACGVRFTILAPSQASRVRRLGSRNWRDVRGGRIDPTMPYLLRLPSGRSIVLFFYDGPIARSVAFEGLLSKGEHFAERLLSAFAAQPAHPQLVHIATDGETYGHHHGRGEMALAYALHYLVSHSLARITNYGEYLEKHPPTYRVEIVEHTSWSCVHGIERWRMHCGCNSGGHPGWQQAWRAPLREAFDWLRDTLMPVYERQARRLFRHPWAARDAYIAVVLDRSAETLERFFMAHATHALDDAEKISALQLLELQRHAMLMYTSCGWFFDELSGIETVQVMQYAGRALQLGKELCGESLEAMFLARLEGAKSNIPEHRNGLVIYEKWVKPAAVDWEKVGAHYAISSLFEDYTPLTKIYCYTVGREDTRLFEAGRAKLLVGRARMTSDITRESVRVSFGVLHFGDHNINAGVCLFQGESMYEAVIEALAAAFAGADFPEVLRLLDRHFGESTYSLRTLFRDEQRKVIDVILAATLVETETIYRQIYEHRAPLMRFLAGLNTPLPGAFLAAAEFILNVDLRRAFEVLPLAPESIKTLLHAAQTEGISLDGPTLAYAFNHTMRRLVDQLQEQPADLVLLLQLEDAVDLLPLLPFEVDIWKAQNVCYELSRTMSPVFHNRAALGDIQAAEWLEHFREVGDKLRVRVL